VSLALGGDAPGPTVNITALPAQLVIDYVRISLLDGAGAWYSQARLVHVDILYMRMQRCLVHICLVGGSLPFDRSHFSSTGQCTASSNSSGTASASRG
jgi:hypothetical protein